MAKRRILLVEPAYRNKYPPLGLMKIASYHRQLGDQVTFVKGCSPQAAANYWDRIYITSLFSFHWATLIDTISFYRYNLFGASTEVFIGGIAASILPELIHKEVGIYPICGCLDRPRMLDQDSDLVVDRLVPDYSILDQVDYEYSCRDSYIGYVTRGCVRRCRFCAVPKLEPVFVPYIDITSYVAGIRERYGEKTHLLLLDNNVLASPKLERIVNDISDLGFQTGAKLGGRRRCVDFNQGLDARLLDPKRMHILSRLPIKPFRLAYDDVNQRDAYEAAVRLAASAGTRVFSTYLLYNYRDKPTQLWDRLHHNVTLSDELGVQISSFPMRYIPITNTDRHHIGTHWNRRYLRSIQCITLVTKGIVSSRHDFFHKAFGRNHREFREILAMPESYIIDRSLHERNGTAAWRRQFRKLTPAQRWRLLQAVSLPTRAALRSAKERKRPGRLKNILVHYLPEA